MNETALTDIQAAFQGAADSDKKAAPLRQAIFDGKGRFDTLQEYTVRLGELAGKQLGQALSAEPEAAPSQDAAAVMLPVLTAYWRLISDAAISVITTANRQANVRLSALRPQLPRNRAASLAKKFGSYATAAEAQWVLGEPVIGWGLYVIDDAVRINAEAQAAAGLRSVVARISDSADCPFCLGHAGRYAPPLNREVFRRHERCRCLIELVPEAGRPAGAVRALYKSAENKARTDRIERVLQAERRISGK